MKQEEIQKAIASLVKLTKLGYAACSDKPPANSYTEYRAQLDRYSDEHWHTKDKIIQRALIEAWLPEIRYAVENSSSPMLHTSSFRKFAEMLTLFDETQYLLRESPYGDLVAGCAMYCVILDKMSYHGFQDYPRILMQTVTGARVTHNRKYSLQEISQALYGESAWLIYRSDVMSDAAYPRLLVRNKVPLLPNIISEQNKDISVTHQTHLPSNF